MISEQRQKQTGRALFWSNFLSEPLFTLYGFIGFILYKDLGASALSISLLITLKPVVTILSFYWSSGLKGKAHKLKTNALWAGLLMRAPFLGCLWVDEVWYVIASAVNYMFWYRAGVPAWVEILKRNLKEGKRERLFSTSSALAYAEGVVLSIAVGGILDQDPNSWRVLFFAASIIGIASLILLFFVQVDQEQEEPAEKIGLKQLIMRPWLDSWELMKGQRDFSVFQWGFMLCGFGIMLIQPTLPLLAVDWLGVKYVEMAAAVSIAKGLGFSLSSPIWARWFERMSILKISSYVFFSVGVFPLILTLSPMGIWWFYLAYFWYGVGQGGSHLVWNMSGPVFAGRGDSSRYMGASVVLAGLRGAVGPGLGGLLTFLFGPIQVLCLGSIFCFYSGLWLYRKRSIVQVG